MKVSSLERFSIESVKLTEGVTDKLIVQIKAIHNGMTRNLTSYTSEALKGSLDSWTQPYQKKVLKNHDMDCEPLGRILAATYAYDESAHKDAVMLTAEITDPDAIQKIMDKRYSTVSVGGSSNSVKCSKCGTDIAKEGLCEHYKGEFYDGEMVYWIVENFEPEEISFVNGPADIYAGVCDIYDQNPLQKPPLSAVMNQSLEGGQTMKVNQSTDPNANVDPAVVTDPAVNTELDEAKAAAEKATNDLAEANAKLEQATKDLEEANGKITELGGTITALEGQVEEANTNSATLKSEKEALESQVVEVRSENHKLVAEKVALSKLFLGKITKEQYDAEVEELVKRTAESLSDSINDLLKESASFSKVEKIDDPTKQSQTSVKTTESKEFESKSEFASYLSDEIKNLFK